MAWSAASLQADTNGASSDLEGGVRPEHVSNAGVQLLSTQFLQLEPLASSMQSNMQLSLVQPVRVPKHFEHAAVYPRRFSMHFAVHDAPPRHWCPHALRSLAKSALPSLFQTAWSAASSQLSVVTSRTPGA